MSMGRFYKLLQFTKWADYSRDSWSARSASGSTARSEVLGSDTVCGWRRGLPVGDCETPQFLSTASPNLLHYGGAFSCASRVCAVRPWLPPPFPMHSGQQKEYSASICHPAACRRFVARTQKRSKAPSLRSLSRLVHKSAVSPRCPQSLQFTPSITKKWRCQGLFSS